MKDLNFFPDKSKKIAVGLSGGVDSSVAAARLVKMGHKVIGFWMWLVEQDSLNLAGCAEVVLKPCAPEKPPTAYYFRQLRFRTSRAILLVGR